MQSRFYKLALNGVFTLLALGLLAFVLFEAKLYFGMNFKKREPILSSGLKTYKVKYSEGEENKAMLYDAINGSAVANFDKPKSRIVEKIDIIPPMGEETPETLEAPEDLAAALIQNPLFKSYYVQLGVFASKQVADESVKNLMAKLISEGAYTTYVEPRALNGRVFYMAQVGVFPDKSSAVQFCEKLQKLGIGCLVVE